MDISRTLSRFLTYTLCLALVLQPALATAGGVVVDAHADESHVAELSRAGNGGIGAVAVNIARIIATACKGMLKNNAQGRG